MSSKSTDRELRELIMATFGFDDEDAQVIDAMQAIAESTAQERAMFARQMSQWTLAFAEEFTAQMGALVTMEPVSDEELDRLKAGIMRIAKETGDEE